MTNADTNEDNRSEFIGFVGIETIYINYNRTFTSKTKLYKYLRAKYAKKPLSNKDLISDKSNNDPTTKATSSIFLINNSRQDIPASKAISSTEVNYN